MFPVYKVEAKAGGAWNTCKQKTLILLLFCHWTYACRECIVHGIYL